jgi:hypothetical protein
MPRDEGPKIGDVARRDGRLHAACRACGHRAVIDPAWLPARYLDMAVSAVRFRCTCCGARGDVRPANRSSRTANQPPNPQRVHALYAFGLYLGAVCSHCQPVQLVRFTLADIARQIGEPDPLVRDAIARLGCPHCGAPVLPSVGSRAGDRAGGGRNSNPP